jgi:TnpA family transposase
MQQVHRWQFQYIGTTSLPKKFSVVELSSFFSYSEIERLELAKKRKEPLRLAAAIQLGFLKMTGCPLGDLSTLPLGLLRHVASELGVPPVAIATLRAIYDRSKTRFDHQWWAMELLGFRKADAQALASLPSYLENEARNTADKDVLVLRAKLWLYQRKYLCLGTRELDSLVAKASSTTEDAFLRYVLSQIPESQIKQWTKEVTKIETKSQRSYIEWLQQPARKKSVNAIREQTARVGFLKRLGIEKLNLDTVPLEKIRAYAEQLRNIRPARFKELKDPLRTLRLVCFLKWTLMEATDTAILLGGRRVTKIMSEAYSNAQALEGKTAFSYHDTVVKVFKKVDEPDLSDAQFRQIVWELKAQYKPPQFPTRASAARWLLSDPNPQIRALLSELRKLELQAEEGNDSVHRVQYLQELYNHGLNELPPDHGQKFGRPWRDLIEGEDRARALRAMEAMTLIGLRKALRSGAVFVDHSEKFRGRHRLMINQTDWARDRINRYGQLSLPLNPHDFLQSIVAELNVKLVTLEEARVQGDFQVDGQRFRIPKSKPIVVGPDVEQQKKNLFDKIEIVQFPDLILEMDSQTGFSKIILQRPAINSTELLQVYTGMLAHGCALDASDVSHMVPQLTTNQVLAGMRYFEDKDLVRAANDAVSGFQRRLPICSAWGDGSLASSDMMSLDVSKQVWRARMDYRRKVASVGTYTAVSDFWSVIYDLPIVLNERQAGPAIDSVLHQKEFDVERLAVDTHGYTEFAMAIAKLLGFSLCPRLAKLADRKLYVPKSAKVPEGLGDMVVTSVSLKSIVEEWDNLVRLAASIDTGHTSATVALARYGSASSDSPTYRAGVHLGRLIRSVYLCDYISSEELRRTIHRILVHGEAVHTLQRAIYAGSFSKPRGQRESELYAASGSLTLMTNLCLAWTSRRMQDILFGESTAALPAAGMEWLSHVSPAHISNINFRGIFTFSVDEYAQWLFTSEVASKAAAA